MTIKRPEPSGPKAMPPLTLVWNNQGTKQDVTVEVEEGMTVEDFKALVYSQTFVPPDRMKIMGLGGGAILKDTDNLGERLAKTKPGAKITLMGTAEEKQEKKPEEEVKFLEDMSPEEVAKLLKEKKVEVLPSGLHNLGNTCFANSTLHVLKSVNEFKLGLNNVRPDAGQGLGGQLGLSDAQFTASLKQLFVQLDNTTDAVQPLQFVASMRGRFPKFAEQQNGRFMQQDAEEFLRELLSVVGNTCAPGGKAKRSIEAGASESTNLVDELFGFKMRSTYKCLESDDEPIDIKTESQRLFICHMGTATEPVNHMHEGVKLSLKEHIEKNTSIDGPLGGRNAQWEKTSVMADLPPYLFIQMARFGYKAANALSGVDATRVKHVRKCAFSPFLDVFDYASPELQEILKIGRNKQQQKKEEEDERKAKALAIAFGEKTENSTSVNETVVPASMAGLPEGPDWRTEVVNNPDNKPLKDYSTGQYELIGIISHKGRSAEGGHYVSWVRSKKVADLKDDEDELVQGGSATSANAPKPKKIKPKTAKSSEEDEWYCYDDEDVSSHLYKNITGLSIDLQGGRADTPIAYVLLYKRLPCVMPDDSVEVHRLGSSEETKEEKSEEKKEGEEGKPSA
jgi:ubiquitin carboxyl-terminal hydrolase 14